MNKWVISDLHLGHNNILQFEGGRLGVECLNVHDHDNILFDRWHETVDYKDIVYVLGDVAFKADKLKWFDSWTGTKILVRGNHDDKDEELYRKAFTKIHGALKYKGVWLTHIPIHPIELRGSGNIHGHVHGNIIDDKRYRAVCIEQNQGFPEDLEGIITHMKGLVN